MTNASELSAFQAEVAKWARRTFPDSTTEAKVAHLKDEVGELAESPSSPEEMADVFLILLHLADSFGVDLLQAARAKFLICQCRKWGEPDERGVVRHVSSVPPIGPTT